jgi:hypothetical protein
MRGYVGERGPPGSVLPTGIATSRVPFVNATGFLEGSGSMTFRNQALELTGALDMKQIGRVINLRAPVNGTDAATKHYVDTRNHTYAASYGRPQFSVPPGTAWHLVPGTTMPLQTSTEGSSIWLFLGWVGYDSKFNGEYSWAATGTDPGASVGLERLSTKSAEHFPVSHFQPMASGQTSISLYARRVVSGDYVIIDSFKLRALRVTTNPP